MGPDAWARLLCYGIIGAAHATTAWRLWRSTRALAERRESLKRTKKRFARFMGAQALWAVVAAGLTMAMSESGNDFRWTLTLPVLILTTGTIDIWRYFAINGEEEKRQR